MKRHLRYSDNVDYLISSIIYLGTHSYYWARSPGNLANELSLDEAKLQLVFDGFPGIFRRSVSISEAGQHYYALQARYAQRDGGDTEEPEKVSYIDPLATDKMQMLITFVLQASDQETAMRRTTISNAIAITAAIIAAIAAVASAVLKH